MLSRRVARLRVQQFELGRAAVHAMNVEWRNPKPIIMRANIAQLGTRGISMRERLLARDGYFATTGTRR